MNNYMKVIINAMKQWTNDKFSNFDTKFVDIDDALKNKVDSIDGKGLSTNDYTIEEKEKLAGIEAGAQVNVQVDWNQNDPTASDYVKNRTHYEEDGREVLFNGVVTCEKHGDGNMASVSDGITIIIGDMYIVELDGTTYNLVGYDDDGYPTIGASYGNLTDDMPFQLFNEDSNLLLYHAISGDHILNIQHKTETVKLIAEKFIPDTIARKNDITWENLLDKPFYGEQTIEWDGNTDGLMIIEHDFGDLVYISDKTPTAEELIGGSFTVSSYDDDSNSNTLVIESVSHHPDYEVASVGEGILICYQDGALELPKAGTYIRDLKSGYYISKLVYGSIKTLDEKFIPDTIARVSDIPSIPSIPVTSVNGMTGDVQIEIPEITVNGVAPDDNGNIELEVGSEQVQADWAQNDATAENYVQNRTHWAEEGILLTEQPIIASLDQIDTEANTVSAIGLTELPEFKDYTEYTVIWNGQTYILNSHSAEWFNNSNNNSRYGTDYYLGNATLLSNQDSYYSTPYNEYPDLPFLLWFSKWTNGVKGFGIHMQGTTPTEVKIQIYEGAHCYHTLDERFLPKSIQSDWTQSDHESIDYIKNKPEITLDRISLIDRGNGNKYHIYLNNGELIVQLACERIEVTTMPTKTTYWADEQFNPAGMVVTAIYPDDQKQEIKDYTYSAPMTSGNSVVTITYTELGIPYTASIIITVDTMTLAEKFVDFEYTINDDGSVTLNSWKGTYNGVSSSSCVIPDTDGKVQIIV